MVCSSDVAMDVRGTVALPIFIEALGNVATQAGVGDRRMSKLTEW